MVSNLALFCLATFQKIGDFFPTHLVTLIAILAAFVKTLDNHGSCLLLLVFHRSP